jgi:hypothetical protein
MFVISNITWRGIEEWIKQRRHGEQNQALNLCFESQIGPRRFFERAFLTVKKEGASADYATMLNQLL